MAMTIGLKKVIMTKYVNDKLRLARKEHACEACHFPIPKNAEYIVSSYTYDGSWHTSKWHTECRAEFNNILTKAGDSEGDPSDTWEDDKSVPLHFVAKYILLGGK